MRLHIVLQMAAAMWLADIVTTYGNSAQADTVVPDGDSYIEAEELKSVIRTRNVDAILETLNKVKQMGYQHEILIFLDDLWKEDREKQPDLPWDVVSLDSNCSPRGGKQ